MSPNDLWHFFPLGYLLSISIETPVLLIGLSPRHPFGRKLLAGVWLTACTYPIVTLVLPLVFVNSSRTIYLIVAETFAPAAECVLFWLAFGREPCEVEPGGVKLGEAERSELPPLSFHTLTPMETHAASVTWRDFAAIVIANLASFGAGEVLNAYHWFGLLS
jgi:hypothetical protein